MTSAVVAIRRCKLGPAARAAASGGLRAMGGFLENDCSYGSRTATSGVVGNGAGPSPPFAKPIRCEGKGVAIFRQTKRTIPLRPYLPSPPQGERDVQGDPLPISRGSNGNFGARGEGVRDSVKTTPRRFCCLIRDLREMHRS